MVNSIRPTTPSAVQNQDRRQEVDPQIREAAEGMEALFVNEMIRAMRQTVESSEMSLNNQATEIYQAMMDDQTADIAARTHNFGLAEQIIDSMTAQQYNKR